MKNAVFVLILASHQVCSQNLTIEDVARGALVPEPPPQRLGIEYAVDTEEKAMRITGRLGGLDDVILTRIMFCDFAGHSVPALSHQRRNAIPARGEVKRSPGFEIQNIVRAASPFHHE